MIKRDYSDKLSMYEQVSRTNKIPHFFPGVILEMNFEQELKKEKAEQVVYKWDYRAI